MSKELAPEIDSDNGSVAKGDSSHSSIGPGRAIESLELMTHSVASQTDDSLVNGVKTEAAK